jgi:hypothetical protein
MEERLQKSLRTINKDNKKLIRTDFGGSKSAIDTVLDKAHDDGLLHWEYKDSEFALELARTQVSGSRDRQSHNDEAIQIKLDVIEKTLKEIRLATQGVGSHEGSKLNEINKILDEMQFAVFGSS